MLTSDIIRECQIQNEDDLIVRIDFGKAFDLISGAFIEKSLQIYSFGKGVQKWVNVYKRVNFFKLFKLVMFLIRYICLEVTAK